MKITKQQYANLIEAQRMWETVPPENVFDSLDWWTDAEVFGEPPTCNTHACFGGWCAWWPAFRAKGVRIDPVLGGIRKRRLYGSDVAESLFGDEDLFAIRRAHPADEDFTGSDHALVTHRLNWVLERAEVAA